MTSSILTNTELNLLCLDIINNLSHLPLWTLEAIKAMHSAGLRSSEACDVGFHIINSETTVNIYQRKTKSFRTVEKNLLSNNYIQLIINGLNHPKISTERQLRYSTKLGFNNFILKAGNKQISSHIFRYNYVRQLMELGYEADYIQANIAHASRTVTLQYMHQPIYKISLSSAT